MPKPTFDFATAIDQLRNTVPGREATMYGPIRDLFIQVLGYPPRQVDIDTAGEGGRPDVTARAPSGLSDDRGNEKWIDWVVVEAKDERGCLRDPVRRERLFEKKSKYIGPHTAWFVMIEPEILIARPVSGGIPETGGNDIELPLTDLSLSTFLRDLERLRYERAGVPEQLTRFRAGDVSLIATERLTWPDPASATLRDSNRVRVARKRFFQSLREATQSLQAATRAALVRLKPEIEEFQQQAREFGQRFGAFDHPAYTFTASTLTLESHPRGPEQSLEHDQESLRLRWVFSKRPHVVRLALDGLPSFQSRTGVTEEKLSDLFAVETANLILARILLLRFFEDHGFFGEMRYVCNGGVQAFQQMRDYFHLSYARLLELAYRDASLVYRAAFDATELDWILSSDYEPLSRTIEWTLFQFSRYDFRTVRGDILSGIYDRFLDRAQRKRLGEFYTPPSVARYIIRRVGINEHSRILDPACGSGTFLVEAFRELAGDGLDRGLAEFKDVKAALECLAGNDLNAFSGILTHIQLLWQILSFKHDIEQQGFPNIRVTSKVNSLLFPSPIQRRQLGQFSEIDAPLYTAVIGNPPYVRAERSSQELDARSEKTYTQDGLSARRNAYTLFIYRALATWCRPATEQQAPGRLGFIVPVSLFDAHETADLRAMFQIGARWTLLEIVDLEAIYRDIFDADVLPVIIIAENRPATDQDIVVFRLADQTCVMVGQADAAPTLHLDDLPEQRISYPDIFTPDGRIMTRLTPARLAVLRKLWRHPTLEAAARPYWVRKQGSQIVEAIDTPPSDRDQAWETRRMIRGGISFRRQRRVGPSGYAIFKGENILASELVGAPAAQQVDVLAASDASLWQYITILPERGFAIAQMAHCPNAVSFNPRMMAFTDTATLFFPTDNWREFPFDLLLLSRLYWFFYGFAARMGVLRQFRSHIYPANLRLLPCPLSLLAIQTELEALREPLLAACRQRFQAKIALCEALAALKLTTLKQRMRSDLNATLAFSESFEVPDHDVMVEKPAFTTTDEGFWVHPAPRQPLEGLWLSREDFARGMALALRPMEGEEVTRSRLLNLPIPVTAEERQHWEATVTRFAEDQLIAEMERRLDDLDRRVGAALGLAIEDVDLVQQECREDPFLSRIRPRFPGTDTRRQGFRVGLDSAVRYE